MAEISIACSFKSDVAPYTLTLLHKYQEEMIQTLVIVDRFMVAIVIISNQRATSQKRWRLPVVATFVILVSYALLFSEQTQQVLRGEN